MIHPTKFADMIEFIQGKMRAEEWEEYVKEYPDLIRIYQELNDHTNVVVLKYHYKVHSISSQPPSKHSNEVLNFLKD